MNKELWKTQIGSHLWGMDHEGSDNDYFAVHIVPTSYILDGSVKNFDSVVMKSNGDDYVSHEIGKVIDELIKGNINFLTAIMSNIVIEDKYEYLPELQNIVDNYGRTKACINSIRGIAKHNYDRYILGNEDDMSPKFIKKCGIISRSLVFGINLLYGHGFNFEAVSEQSPDDVLRWMDEFEIAVEESELPDTTDPKIFRHFLHAVRLDEMRGYVND